ncbi:MAG: AmmeMemoRadiSam system protein B [Candidatus Eisenbacteria bacterium]
MSSDAPQDPPRKSRLIIPGAEADDAPSEKPRLVTSTGDDIEPETPRQASRIVLPPGVSRETPEDLPEYPRLRPLMIVPVRDGKRELLVITDPLGVVQGQPVLGIEALPLLQLMDGTVSLSDMSAALMRESKDIRVSNMVRDFVAQLDELLLLDSPRYQTALRAMQEAYHPLEIRPAALADRAYPADPTELRVMLDAHFAEAEGWRAAANEPASAADARPRAVMTPHLDPRRSGPAIARAVSEIGSGSGPLRVVVIGTGHQLVDDMFALTRKHFETPLGKVTCDTAFVDKVAARIGETAYRSELAHRDEHSIEFVVLYLKHRLGERPFTIVPILAGGFHTLLDDGKMPREDAAFEALITAVRDTERELGGATVYVGPVDFSHIGPRFGDAKIDEKAKTEIERIDRAAIEPALKGDADAWFAAIATHGDATRICGFAPVYALLRCAEPGAGRLLRYEQSDEPDTSMVSVAAAVWP